MARIPFCTTFALNSIFIKAATTNDYREKSGKVVIFKDKDNNNNLMYGKVFSIGLHFCTFLYNSLLMRVCDDVIKNTLLHFTTKNTDIVLKIIKMQKKVTKLFGVPFLCCIFVVEERDINNQINKLQIMTTIENTKEKQRRQLLYWIDEQIMAKTLERKEFCQKQIMAIKRQQRS